MPGSTRNHRKRTFSILTIVISSAVMASGWGDRISVRDPRPVGSAIRLLETRFSRVITYEDPPLVNPDDTLDVTESVRRDLHQYAPGKAPRVIVPRGGELSIEYGPNEAVEVVLSHVLSESERAVPSATFRTEETDGIIHVIPRSIKGPNGETILVRSILDSPVQSSAQERNGMQMLEAWRDAVSTSSKKRVMIGAAPFGMLLSYKDDRGISSPNARDALSEILMRVGKTTKLSWQVFYDPGRQIYAINIHSVQ